mgnify:CR=1 FL=1
MHHVIWDWNGTLFDDLPIVVEAVNESLALFGIEPIDEDGYRSHYTRPVFGFYERLLGRPVTGDEWKSIDRTFHDHYRLNLGRAGLAADARAALDLIDRTHGGTQSLLSMWWHDELAPLVQRLGIDRYMVRVDGNQGSAGDTKTAHLERHLEKLAAALGETLPPSRVVMIGDSFDDFAAAAEIGVRCVLFDGGSHHRDELEAAGAPVADSLLDAVRLGGFDG